MKKILITDIILVVSLVALCFGVFKISSLENENRSLKEQVIQRDTLILNLGLKNNELHDEIEFFEDMLQEREMEVRYWGMKYDSIRMK